MNSNTSQSGTRPKFGNPKFATLSVGGNDIDFPGIIFNCILELSIPFSGMPRRDCPTQIDFSWDLINNDKLVYDIDHLIKKTIDKGRTGTVGDDFKLYVLGFGEFFNEVDPACNDVTFARTANPKDDGKPHQKMTIEIRKTFNAMSRGLNAAIKKAVQRSPDLGVKFIDIQANGALDGRRFCEEGIKEPDQNNKKLWFFHYPYNQPDADVEYWQNAYDSLTRGMSQDDVNSKWPLTSDLINALISETEPDPENLLDAFWSRAGQRFKVFHQQPDFHSHIKDLVFDEWKRDRDVDSTPPNNPPSEDKNVCHGVNGNYYVEHRDVAVANAQHFCGQDSCQVE
jgi:hypothetical protein